MTVSIVMDGITFNDTDFVGENGYGYNAKVQVNGTDYPRFIALFVAAMRDLSKPGNTTSSSSVSNGSGTKTFTVAADRPFTPGSFVIVAKTSSPTTTYMIGQVTAYSYPTLTISVGASDYIGSGTHTDWTIALSTKPNAGTPGADGVFSLTKVTRSSNTILGAADKGKCFIATSSFTQTFDACATLASGWAIIYKNDSSGYITFDHNSTETIGDRSTIQIGPGESVIIYCDGTKLHILASHQTVTIREGIIENPLAATYVHSYYMPRAGKIIATGGKTQAGTLTMTTKINGSSIGGSADSITTTYGETARTSSNSFSAGDKVDVDLSSVSGASGFQLQFTEK